MPYKQKEWKQNKNKHLSLRDGIDFKITFFMVEEISFAVTIQET